MGNLGTGLTICTVLLATFGLLAPASPLRGQQSVSFPTGDGGLVRADEYGSGLRAVVLVPGGRFGRESWKDQARQLESAGFRVLAIDLRGNGGSHGPDGTGSEEGYPLDVLAAIRYLCETGSGTVSVVGASIGGWAAARAVARADPGEIDALVLLAASPIEDPERLGGRKLFVTARHDTTGDGTRPLSWIRDQYERAPPPRELLVLDGAVHAQFLFETMQGETLMHEILRFLSVAP